MAAHDEKTTSETAPVGSLSIPGRHGGRLRNGGTNKGGTGRPPNLIRAGLRESIPAEVKKLEALVRKIAKLGDAEKTFKAQRELAEFKAKYGLGTTVTETDSKGRDVTVRVIREMVRAGAADDN